MVNPVSVVGRELATSEAFLPAMPRVRRWAISASVGHPRVPLSSCSPDGCGDGYRATRLFARHPPVRGRALRSLSCPRLPPRSPTTTGVKHAEGGGDLRPGEQRRHQQAQRRRGARHRQDREVRRLRGSLGAGDGTNAPRADFLCGERSAGRTCHDASNAMHVSLVMHLNKLDRRKRRLSR